MRSGVSVGFIGSRRPLLIGAAQVGPLIGQVGAQFFAGDCAKRCSLDVWAALCGDWAMAANPLVRE